MLKYSAIRYSTSMVRLSKTRFWDIFSTISYFLFFLAVLMLMVVIAYVVNRLPEILGI